MRHNGFCILLAALAAGWMAPCAWSAEADGQSETAPKDDAKAEPAVTAPVATQPRQERTECITIKPDPHGLRDHYLRRVAEADRVEFDLFPESNLDFLKQLIGRYAETHGHWHKVTVEPRDPAAFWVTWFKPVLRLAKREFRVGEAIPLTIEAHKPSQADRPDRLASAPWARFNVLNLRIVDNEGNEINPFLYPVSGSDGRIRSKVIYGIEKKTIDLTAFVEPYFGTEFVYPFGPGTYRVTYYMHAFLDSPADKIFENRRLGSKTSNTVTFTVIPADGAEPVDLDALRDQAEGLVTQGKANEAVQAYKRVILHTSDQPTIEKAIRQILAIRRCSSHDGLFERFEKTSFAERMNTLRQNEKAWRDLDGNARRLSLVHLPPKERRERLDQWLDFARLEYLWRTGQTAGHDELIARHGKAEAVWEGLHFGHLFAYPQFRPFLEEAVKRPDDCPIGYLKPYLMGVEDKDPRVLRAFLERDTRTVLMYYNHRSRTPPMALVPFLPAHFDDKHIGSWAVETFIRAAGLDLRMDPRRGYGLRPYVSQETVRSFVDVWWGVHAVDFGATAGADDETILGRLAAIRAADEVVQGKPSKTEKDEQGTAVQFYVEGTIHTPAINNRDPWVVMPEGAELTEETLANDRLYILCLRRPQQGSRFTLAGPHGIWAVPKQAPTRETN